VKGKGTTQLWSGLYAHTTALVLHQPLNQREAEACSFQIAICVFATIKGFENVWQVDWVDAVALVRNTYLHLPGFYIHIGRDSHRFRIASLSISDCVDYEILHAVTE
jgi:hypothetical protein